MYLLQTVSTVPRARPQSARRSRSMDRNGEEFAVQYPPPVRRAAPNPAEAKKKEKKWSLGGLFRRRKKGVDSDSSSPEEEEPAPRKGFLARRREKRKQRTKLVGTFDHVVVKPGREPLPPHQQQQQLSSSDGSSRRGRFGLLKARVEAKRDQQRAESSSDEADGFPVSPSLTRFRSDESLSLLQRDGSFNKRSRVARTERYIRRLSRDEEGILKREAEMDPQQRQRLSKSDAEGSFNISPPVHRHVNKGVIPNNNRWAATVLYQESSDLEHRYLTRTPSATPSPAQSPLVRHKQTVQYASSAPSVDPSISTFPPSHYHGPVISMSPPKSSSVRMPVVARTYSTRGVSPASSNRSNEPIVTHGLPRTRIEYIPTRQNVNYEPVYSKVVPNTSYEFQSPSQRSHSYDSNIHHVSTFGTNLSGPSTVTGTDDVMVVQFPISRPRVMESTLGRGSSASPSLFKQGPPPPPPRDPQRRLTTQQDPPRPMSYAFENGSPHTSRLEYSLSHGSQPLDRNANVKTFSFVPQPHIISNIPSTASAWAGYQRRSNSDNQLAGQFVQTNQLVRPQITIPRPRPSSVTPEAMRPLPQQVPQQVPQQYNQSRHVLKPNPDFSAPPKQPPPINNQFQYFADQQPRSRKPIHIQCNSVSSEQPYLSDSQVVMMKPPYQDRRNPILNATEFWRQKEQEGVMKQRKSMPTKPPLQHSCRSDRSRSNSPRPREHVIPDSFRARPAKLRMPPLTGPARSTESLSSLSGQSDLSSPMQPPKMFADNSYFDSYEPSKVGTLGVDSIKKKDIASLRPLSMVLENMEIQEQPCSSPINEEVAQTLASVVESTKAIPPVPPTRRYSRQSSTSSIEASEWMGDDAGSEENLMKKRRSSNLEDALNELEAIYKSLRLGDEDLLDRAERRDLPTAHQQRRDSLSQGYTPWNISRGAESDSGFNYGHRSSYDSSFEMDPPPRRQRAPSMRRSGIPDKVTDDMAYRRLNPKDRLGSQDIRNMVSQSGSYILASPALSQSPDAVQQRLGSSISDEPDVTFDDVVFRNIRHTNNSLKIVDPQPLFGIPIGPIAPAANSDYLHATPVERYRPTFKPRKIPDVVKDDLAFRNLRKDPQKDSSGLPSSAGDDVGGLLSTTRYDNTNFSLRKKRAVRSLSANLMSLVHKEPLSVAVDNTEQEFEKAQSLSDLPDALQVAQQILEGKEVIGGGSVKLRNLPSTPVELPKHYKESEGARVAPVSWVERALLDRHSLGAGTSTSTETLTDSRANLQQDGVNKRSSWQQRLRVYIPQGGEQSQSTPKPTDDPGSPIDEGQLEELLSALAREAHATSEKLNLELQQLVEDSANLHLEAETDPTPLKSVLDVNLEIAIVTKPSSLDTTQVENEQESSLSNKHRNNVNISLSVEHSTENPPEVTHIQQEISISTSSDIKNSPEALSQSLPKESGYSSPDLNPNIKVQTENGSEVIIKPPIELHLEVDEELCNKTATCVVNNAVEEQIECPNDVVHERGIDVTDSHNTTQSTTNVSRVPEDQDRTSADSDVFQDSVEVQKDESEASVEVQKSAREASVEVEECVSGRVGTSRQDKSGPSLLQTVSSEGEEFPSSCSWYLDPANILVACSYCIACTHNFVGIDVFAVLGIVLAMISFLAFLNM